MKKIVVFMAISVFLFSSALAGVVNNINPAGSADVFSDVTDREINFSFSGITVKRMIMRGLQVKVALSPVMQAILSCHISPKF